MVQGPVLAEEIGLGVDEVEDVQVARPEELLDVLLGVRGQDPQPEALGLEAEDELADAGKEVDLVHPAVELLLRAQEQPGHLDQGDAERRMISMLDRPRISSTSCVVEGLEMELLGMLVDHADDGGEGVGQGAVEIEDQRRPERRPHGYGLNRFGDLEGRHSIMASSHYNPAGPGGQLKGHDQPVFPIRVSCFRTS